MNREEVDAFLAEADDVIEDWEGSPDAAGWSADGSHEHDTGGNYYAEDGGHGYPWYYPAMPRLYWFAPILHLHTSSRESGFESESWLDVLNDIPARPPEELYAQASVVDPWPGEAVEAEGISAHMHTAIGGEAYIAPLGSDPRDASSWQPLGYITDRGVFSRDDVAEGVRWGDRYLRPAAAPHLTIALDIDSTAVRLLTPRSPAPEPEAEQVDDACAPVERRSGRAAQESPYGPPNRRRR